MGSMHEAVQTDAPIDFTINHPLATWWTEPKVIGASLLTTGGLVAFQYLQGGWRPSGFMLAAAAVWFVVVWVLASRPPHLPTFAFDAQEEMPVYTGRRSWCPKLSARRRVAIAMAISTGFTIVLWATLQFG